MHKLLIPAGVVLLALTLQAGCATTKPAARPATASADTARAKPGAPKARFKPFTEVITAEAQSDSGLFAVHRLGDKVYFQIPDSVLERELLLVSRIAGTVENLAFGGAGMTARPQQVVRWQRQGDNLLLRHVSYESVASDTLPIYQAVRNNNFEPVVDVFKIEALGPDSASTLIDATKLFTNDVPLLGALNNGQRQQFQVRRLDNARSFVTQARSFPLNVEVRHVLTYDAAQPPADAPTGTLSVEMSQSIILLPKVPMQPRLEDPRVGFFTVDLVDYGLDEPKAARRSYITRWRLEPKDPAAYARGELVEPVKPIVYYIDPATPEKWRRYLKEGVEMWQRAFEAAGFKNAIMAKDPPTPEEDPDWSPEDVRYSVIRYVTNEIENAQGPHVHDPRSGEILESDILWYHNIMQLMRSLYLIQTAAHNEEARTPRLNDELMGALIRYVAAHEVGHTLGLPHNWGASHAYPVDSLRSPTFTARYGVSPSIMDYSRFNYVRQPGDGEVAMIPGLGPYDLFAIEWGYRIVPDARDAYAEKPTLHSWIRAHEDDPMYFYGRQTGSEIDPRSQREDIGDDPVKASRYAAANLERVADNLVEWTSTDGAFFDDLEHVYNFFFWHWGIYMGHPARLIGGIYETPKTADQGGAVYEPVPEAKQREAMAFLHEYAFASPTWLVNPQITDRLDHSGFLDQARGAQAGVLNLVLEPGRLARMIETEARLGRDAYSPREMLAELRAGLWSELRRGTAVDVYRRNLQRAYLDRLAFLMTQEQPNVPQEFRQFVGFTPVNVAQSDIRALVRGELEAVDREAAAALARTRDEMTRLHLRDVRARIADILDPKD